MTTTASLLALDLSQWIIESTAQEFSRDGKPAFGIQSLATQLVEPLSQDQAVRLSGNDALEQVAHVERVSRLVHERLGVQIRAAAVGVRPLGEGPGLTAEHVTNWLAALGYEASGELAESLLMTPVPVLGSPPEEWLKIGELVGAKAPSPFVIAAGLAVWNERPVVAILAGGTGLVVWFTKPFARTVRDHYVEVVRERLERRDRLTEKEAQLGHSASEAVPQEPAEDLDDPWVI